MFLQRCYGPWVRFTILSLDLSGAPMSEVISRHDVKEAAEIASREEMAYLRAMGRPRTPQPELPAIKEPVLSDDWPQRIDDLDEAIFGRGIGVDRDRFLSLGRKRFAELLVADRKAPRSTVGSGLDLTRFENVQQLLQAYQATTVPARKMREQLAGSGKERDQVRNISDFDDLWKSGERKQVLDDIDGFRRRFESLCLGQSIVSGLSKDGRLRSHFLCGGRGRKIALLHEWLSVLERPLTIVSLRLPTYHLLAWLADEQAASPDPVDLARGFFAVRAPTESQIQMAQAVLEAFLFDLGGWESWEFIGRQTRSSVHVETLAGWRKVLEKRFPAIASFHAQVRSGCFVQRGFGAEYHHEFQPEKHRVFLDRTVRRYLRRLSGVLALALDETLPNKIVGRFEGQVWCKGKPPKQRAEISAPLDKAFPGAILPLEFLEVTQ
jgi:hypothetical protein